MMPPKIYDWMRFWCPREGKLNLSDDGYLWNPDMEFGSIYNPDVVPFESISKFSCLALLGEPGMGKSTAMQSQRGSIDSRVTESGDASLWVDLRSFQTDVRLVQEIFEAPAFQAWLNGKHRLHLFLDSLDECLLRVDTVAALLIEEVGKCPVDRLHLRIACRTADWPGSLEEGLKRFWSEETVKVYELAPLRRVDVVEAAKTDGLNADNFLKELHKREVVPLAIKPVTLRFLLNTYKRHGEFPSSQADLYSAGCRLLCEETSESRRAAQQTGTLSASQRFVVAARIAALTIFANRYTIWTSFDAGDVPSQDIEISALCGGKEGINGEVVAVNEMVIKEVLDTGLFSSRGPNRMGWAHQTYAEFLAASYLVQCRMTFSQVMSLIVHPDDADRKLVPQLHETAAWLAGMMPHVFREIMKTDPEVLLRSDVATADVKDRAALVDALLKRHDEEKLLDRDLGGRTRYEKLAHPNLADQLEPFIRDRTKGLVVRRVATDIAEACELRDLLPVLTELALDRSDSLPVRVNAAYAVGRIGDDTTKARLKPLATGDAGDDLDDELKGCGLRAVWPNSMTAKELFPVLTAAKRSDYFGAYHMFITHDLTKSLQPSHLPEALLWVEMQGPTHFMTYSFRKLSGAIVMLGWEHIDSPGVLEALARAALSRIKHHDSLVQDRSDHSLDVQLREEQAKRRRLLDNMVVIHADADEDVTEIAYSQSPIVLTEDLPWMIERLSSAHTERTKQTWSRLISRSLDRGNPRQIDAVLVACETEPVLAEDLRWLLKPVELGSPEAEKLKADYLEWQKWDRKERNRPLLDPPPAIRIEKLLDQYEAGDYSAWWKLNREMTLKPDSTHYYVNDELESDLTVLPGWEAATTATRQRIVNAAKSYLRNQDPETNQWLGTNTFYRPAVAGYRAFRLLLHEDHDFISNLPNAVWRKWAPSILDERDHNNEAQLELVKFAYRSAPDEVVQTLSILIDKENNESGHISIIDKVQICWDERLGNLVMDKIKDKSLKPESMRVLLEDLIDHDVQEAESFAKSLLCPPLPASGDVRSKAIVAATVLMRHAKNAGWSVVWPAINSDPAFSTEVIAIVASREGWGDKGGIWQKINEDKLADLFLWLVRQYPYSEDPHRNNAGEVTSRESIARWRDSILQNLKMKGTRTACDAIRRIIHEHPELPWLKWTLMDAQTQARRHTWAPLKPADILTLAANQELRVVQSGDQLLDVIIESLKRLEAKLQGEIAIAQFLWEGSKAARRPRDEASFCDFIKWQLEEDLRGRGIIVNREVQIHRGERTDIYVNAVVLGQGKDVLDSLTVIIEAKGCWHSELDIAIETQLLGRYLTNNPCQHGLYLVGWFNCDLWDDNDYRKDQAQKVPRADAQRKFEAQALELSKQGKSIKAFVLDTALR